MKSAKALLALANAVKAGGSPVARRGLMGLIYRQHDVGRLRDVGEVDRVRLEQRVLDRQPEPPSRERFSPWWESRRSPLPRGGRRSGENRNS